jgi:hypothetical protein
LRGELRNSFIESKYLFQAHRPNPHNRYSKKFFQAHRPNPHNRYSKKLSILCNHYSAHKRGTSPYGTVSKRILPRSKSACNIANKYYSLDGGIVVRAWDQEVCSLYGLRFEPCGCSYDGHWRLTWSLTSRPVGLVEGRASWPEHPR